MMDTGEIQAAPKKMGRKLDERRQAYMKKFEKSKLLNRRQNSVQCMDQLDACADDCARRILLGKSK